MNRILITGCNGFIGRHLTGELPAQCFSVRGVDKSTTVPVTGAGGAFDFHPLDITDAAAPHGIAAGIDTVIRCSEGKHT